MLMCTDGFAAEWREYCESRFVASGKHKVADVGYVDLPAIRRCSCTPESDDQERRM